MKTVLFVILIAWGTQCLAQSVHDGSYVVVRGAVEGCELWSFRILDVTRVEGDDPVSLLNIPDISVAGLTDKQVKSNLVTAIQSITGTKPESITVEILESEQEYQSIAKEYLVSLNALLDGFCPVKSQSPGLEDLEKSIQKIRKQDIARSVI